MLLLAEEEAVVHNLVIIYTFRSVMLPASYYKHIETNPQH